MKQKIFTLVMMLALVIVAGSAFAQSTPKSPYEGATETYTVTGLTNGDTYAFYVTATGVTSDPAGSAETSGGGVFTLISASSTGTVASNSATVDLEWNVGTGPDFLLWVVIQDQTTNCFNYRYVTITPVDNELDFTLTALGVDDDVPTTLAGNESANSGNDCPVVFNESFDDEGSPNNGSTYVYYRVDRVNGVNDNDWEFTFSATNNGTGVAGANVEYMDDWGGTWSTTAPSSVSSSTASPDNIFFVRVLVTAATASTGNTQAIAGTIADQLEQVSNIGDSDSGNDSATYSVNDIPVAGTFSGF